MSKNNLLNAKAIDCLGMEKLISALIFKGSIS